MSKIVREKSSFTRKSVVASPEIKTRVTSVRGSVNTSQIDLANLIGFEAGLTEQIFEGQTCRVVRKFARANRQFDKLIQNGGYLEKAANLGYPRNDNRAKIFNYDNYELDEPFLNHINRNLPKGIIKGDLIIHRYYHDEYNIRGDYYIFNGCDVEQIQEHSNFPLPRPFEVVKDNISVNYWASNGKDDELIDPDDGILFSGNADYDFINVVAVNFDHRPYSEEIINNLRSTFKAIYLGFESEFTANGKIYQIRIEPSFLGYRRDFNDETLNKMKTILSSKRRLLPFTVDGRTEDLLILHGQGTKKIDTTKYF